MSRVFCCAGELAESAEGVSLLLRRPWADHLTVIATALLLPPGIYGNIR